VLNKKLPLIPNKTYALEDIYTLSKTILNKMCWRFDVSGWVGNVPNLLRDAISNIPRFASLYSLLSEEQQEVLSFLCESAGRPVLVSEIKQHFSSTMPSMMLHTTLHNLVQEGWLLEGENPHALLAIAEFEMTLKVIPAFYSFLKAELPQEYQSTVQSGQYFSDLVEMAAFMYVEKPKLTIKGFMSKTVLRRLVSKLSEAATKEWEELAVENLYTNPMGMLLRGLQSMNAMQSTMSQVDHRYYDFDTNEWDNFIFSPPTHRLLQAMSLEFMKINTLKRGSLSFVASVFIHGAQLDGIWQTSGYLMMRSIIPASVIQFSERDPFSSEYWMESVLLEPMLYLGLFEKTQEKLATPWLHESQKVRCFWRLTPLGKCLGEWLAEQKNMGEVARLIENVDIFGKNVNIEFSGLFEKWSQVLPIELEQQLIIQPDLSFFVPRFAPPYVLWILSVFGTTEVQDYIYQGSFSRDSVLRALKGGVPITELFDVIADHSKVPPADNVVQALEHWCASYDRTIFAKTTILACDTPALATEIAAQSKLAPLVIGLIGPQTLLIKPEGEGPIRKWLEKKNWVPRPGVVHGDVLHQWLNKE